MIINIQVPPARAAAGGVGYLNQGGDAQGNCKDTSAFALSPEGVLSVYGDPENIFSVDVGVDFAPLAPSKPGKSIQTTWAVTGNDVTWTNNAFLNGAAVFCADTSGVVAYFTVDPPSDCTEVKFVGEDGKYTVCVLYS